MIKGKLKCESCNRQISLHQKVNCVCKDVYDCFKGGVQQVG